MAIGYGEENKYAKYGQPTLDLVFTGPKESVTDRVGNVGLEFTRSSTATYVGSDGLIKSAAVNEARFDHDKDGNGLGLLIEESKTNYVTTSENLTGWSTITLGDGVTPTVQNVTDTSPDNGSTVTEITLERNTASTINYSIYRKQFGTTAVSTGSMYLKASRPQDVGKVIDFYHNQGSPQDFVSVTLTNTWQRVSSIGIGGAVGFLSIALFNSTSSTGEVKVLAWGAQVEEGSFPTSYIPTSGSTVTRAVDTVSLTGTNFSSWYNGSEGSIFIDMKRPVGPSNSGAFLDFHNDAGLFLQDASGNFISRIGKETAFITLGNPATTTDYKIASSYQSANDFKVSSNGSSVTSASTAVDFTTATELHIGRGNNSTTAHYRNGPRTLHLKRFTFWPTRLSDSDLQSLTE